MPPSSKALVDEYLKDIDKPLDPEKFMVQVLPFETDNDTERYKAVMSAIDNFVGTLNINIPGLGKKLLDIWHRDIFTNSTKKDAAIKLNKKNIICRPELRKHLSKERYSFRLCRFFADF